MTTHAPHIRHAEIPSDINLPADARPEDRPSPRRQRPQRAGRTVPIGLIVAGSLTLGLLAALVLVLGPLGGAPEDVISGTALLAFAGGWALLAALSACWTRQPQRWAAVPAGLLALLGAGLLIVAPPSAVLDALGWVWPLGLLALAVWMTVQARRHLRSRTRPWLLYPLCGVLILAAVGGGYETVSEAIDQGARAMPGQLIDVGGHRLHITCTGTGSPTVVLEPGAGEPAAAMAWITPAVARTTRVCGYDRAGRGWSEAVAGPQDGIAVATDLHTLLARAHVPGPYVLAGHSFGGLYVLNFAARYPDQVAGMVLLDATSPQQFTLSSYPTISDLYRRVSAVFPSLARFGVGRLAYGSAFAELPPQARDEERAFWATAGLARSAHDEWVAAPTAMRQAQALKSLGAKPLIVLTALRDAQAGWLPLQNALARLSTNSRHRVLPQVTHAMLTEDKGGAAASSQAIRDVVTAVRAATLLTH